MDVSINRKRPLFKRILLAVVGLALIAAVCVLAWVRLNNFGSEPSYFVDSYGALEADFAADATGIRLPDLGRYESLPGFRYKVTYDGGRISMENKSYLIFYQSGDGGGMAGDAALCGVATSLVGLRVGAADLRSYDRRGEALPEVEPTVELGGTGVGVSHNLRNDADGAYGEYVASFVLGGYLYEVKGTYCDSGEGSESEGAYSEVLDIVESLTRNWS